MKRNRKIKKSNIVLLCLIIAYFTCETIEFSIGYKLIKDKLIKEMVKEQIQPE